jgi:MFS superfamily sulfate permease-like transporter
MALKKRKIRFYVISFLRHDFKASINVFLETLPLCIGIALASGTPIYSGFVAGITAGIIVTFLSGSHSSIRGPAAGLATLTIASIYLLDHDLSAFFAAVFLAGVFQIIFGLMKAGRAAQFIPSAVVRGMMAAIGVMLILQEIPYAIGVVDLNNEEVEFFHFISIESIASHTVHLVQNISPGVTLISCISFFFMILWDRSLARKMIFLPYYFLAVWLGVLIAYLYKMFLPQMALEPSQYVSIPANMLSEIRLHNVFTHFNHAHVWRVAALISLVASIEGLVNIEAIDKHDHYNRMTPRNRELISQGIGNMISGMFGGLPITTVIARSMTNLETGARSRMSSFFLGVWLLVAGFFVYFLVNIIPYGVVAALLIRIGFKLADPARIIRLYKSGKEQFVPFMVTMLTILITDLLIGLLVGVAYTFYCLIKHSYKAAYKVNHRTKGYIPHYSINLAGDVNFLNKKGIEDVLDKIPNYSTVEIIGHDGGIIDHDILEVLDEYKLKAHNRHIELILKDMPELLMEPA